jgi:hypothetical protein
LAVNFFGVVFFLESVFFDFSTATLRSRCTVYVGRILRIAVKRAALSYVESRGEFFSRVFAL